MAVVFLIKGAYFHVIPTVTYNHIFYNMHLYNWRMRSTLGFRDVNCWRWSRGCFWLQLVIIMSKVLSQSKVVIEKLHYLHWFSTSVFACMIGTQTLVYVIAKPCNFITKRNGVSPHHLSFYMPLFLFYNTKRNNVHLFLFIGLETKLLRSLQILLSLFAYDKVIFKWHFLINTQCKANKGWF